jgi:hypothetical protein
METKSDKKKNPSRVTHLGEGDLTHYLGNDDYRENVGSQEEQLENPKLYGKVAEGNELEEEDLEDEQQEAPAPSAPDQKPTQLPPEVS